MDVAAVLTVIGLFGSLQALVLGLAIVARRGARGGAAPALDRRRNLALGALLVVFGAAVAVIALDHSGWVPEAVPLVWIEHTLAFCYPLFLLYARLVVGDPPGRPWMLVHALPLGLWLLDSLVGALTGELPWWPPILALVLYQVAYTVRVAWLAFVEAPEAPAVGLLRLMVVALAVVHLAQAVRFVFSDVELLRDVVPVVATVVLYAVVYRALGASDILHPPPAPYAASGLEPARAAEEASRLERLLESERLFLRPDLDLETTARHLGIGRTRLSQIVNQGLGTSFNDLVNRYRVAEAQRLLDDPALDHLTIQAIGERAGFSARSAFYAAFRQHTGTTPGRVRRRRDGDGVVRSGES
jgi:AraC-like DNA-binding protein